MGRRSMHRRSGWGRSVSRIISCWAGFNTEVLATISSNCLPEDKGFGYILARNREISLSSRAVKVDSRTATSRNLALGQIISIW